MLRREGNENRQMLVLVQQFQFDARVTCQRVASPVTPIQQIVFMFFVGQYQINDRNISGGDVNGEVINTAKHSSQPVVV